MVFRDTARSIQRAGGPKGSIELLRFDFQVILSAGNIIISPNVSEVDIVSQNSVFSTVSTKSWFMWTPHGQSEVQNSSRDT